MHTPYAGVSCITRCLKRHWHNILTFLLLVLLQMACLPKPVFVDVHYQCKHQLDIEGWLGQLAANQAANGSIQRSSACVFARHIRLVCMKQ